MRYIPHTEEEITSMMEAVGVDSLDELFSDIPESCHRKNELALPEALTEWELDDHIRQLAGSMPASSEYKSFIGAGSYSHFIPAVIPYLLGRSEFSTAYTPYQPEISQGTLHAIYEYQTLVSRLLGMEIANASMYDGATALAEALLMAIRITKKDDVAISMAVHPDYRRVIEAYFRPTGYTIHYLPYGKDGRTMYDTIPEKTEPACVAVQSPNFFGCMEEVAGIAGILNEQKTLLIVSFTEPLAYGLYKTPGELGADIACGEGQSLGIPRSYGGPGLGLFSSKEKYMRYMPGRIVGQTTDRRSNRGFVLTLSTREQHIRREKATSNICSNQSLCALTACMYMATAGQTGMRELARLNYDKSEYLKEELGNAGFRIPFSSPSFNEFVVEFPEGFEDLHRHLLKKKIFAGLPLEPYYPELKNHCLMCATETNKKEDMDRLVREVK